MALNESEVDAVLELTVIIIGFAIGKLQFSFHILLRKSTFSYDHFLHFILIFIRFNNPSYLQGISHERGLSSPKVRFFFCNIILLNTVAII